MRHYPRHNEVHHDYRDPGARMKTTEPANRPRAPHYHHTCAAPIPELPSASTVNSLKLSNDNQIRIERGHLENLKLQRNGLVSEYFSVSFSHFDVLGLTEENCCFISNGLIDKVLSENTSKAKKANTRNRVANTHSFTSIYHLPPLDLVSNLPGIYFIVYTHSFRLSKRSSVLVEQYQVHNVLSRVLCRYLDKYQKLTSRKHSRWPREFEEFVPYTFKKVKEMVAPPQPQLINEEDRLSYSFDDNTGFVSNPIAAFHSFSERISWREDERETYIREYILHPKEFRKIASRLPDKTTGDCIEFYYLYKYELQLKEKAKQKLRR